MTRLPSEARALVIGGGFGGIAAALRLRAKGYDVEIVDRCPRLGGRAQVLELDGFRHDMGPTVLTAPFLIEELFQLFGRRIESYVKLVELTPWYRFRFPSGEAFDYGGTIEHTQAEIARFNVADADGYARLVDASRRFFEVAFERLGDRPFHSPLAMLRAVPDLLRLRAHRSVYELVASHIQDERIRQALSIQPLLIGGNPFDTTCIYGLIHYLERRWGIYFAMGGTGALVDGLAKLMSEVGIRMRLNQSVDSILIRDGAACGARLASGETIAADVVVSNADPMRLYGAMIEPHAQSAAARMKRRFARLSMGLFVLFFGTRGTYPDVAHHTIWLGRRYRELLADIFSRRILAEDFSLYLHRPTATDTSFAPPGCDSFYALVPVPNLQAGIDWATAAPLLRERIIAALDATVLPGLKTRIMAAQVMTPADFEENYLSVGGAGFSIAPLLSQSAWFRFHNRGEGPRNLYLVGAGTHPGAGIPGVLTSAKVMDRLVPPADALRSFAA